MKPSKNNPVKHQGQTSKADDPIKKTHTHTKSDEMRRERGERQARGQSHGELFFSNEMHVNWPWVVEWQINCLPGTINFPLCTVWKHWSRIERLAWIPEHHPPSLISLILIFLFSFIYSIPLYFILSLPFSVSLFLTLVMFRSFCLLLRSIVLPAVLMSPPYYVSNICHRLPHFLPLYSFTVILCNCEL